MDHNPAVSRRTLLAGGALVSLLMVGGCLGSCGDDDDSDSKKKSKSKSSKKKK